MVVASALAACTGVAGPGTPSLPPFTPSTSAPPTSSVPDNPSPLTGLDAHTPEGAATAVIAVAVDVGTAAGRPTAALAQADLVYQEFGAGGVSRLLAIYQTNPTGLVGPVAQTRPMDGKLLPVLAGTLVSNGGTEKFEKALAAAKVPQMEPARQPRAFTRVGSAELTDVRAARAYLPKGAPGPSTMWTFADTDQPLATKGDGTASKMTVTMPGRTPVVWTLDKQSLLWESSIGGTVVAVRSVVVMVTDYRTTLDHFPKGNTVAVSKIFGSGAATVVSGGQAASGTYVHPGATNLANLIDASGYAMLLTPGKVWVMFVPTGSAVALETEQ